MLHLKLLIDNWDDIVNKILKSQTILFHELKVGMSESFKKKITQEDIENFAKVSSDFNPVHFDKEFAKKTIFKEPIAHGMLSASFISAVIGERLPGNGTIYLSQTLKFHRPVFINQEVETTVKIQSIMKEKKQVSLDCNCKVNKKIVISGLALVLAPSTY